MAAARRRWRSDGGGGGALGGDGGPRRTLSYPRRRRWRRRCAGARRAVGALRPACARAAARGSLGAGAPAFGGRRAAGEGIEPHRRAAAVPLLLRQVLGAPHAVHAAARRFASARSRSPSCARSTTSSPSAGGVTATGRRARRAAAAARAARARRRPADPWLSVPPAGGALRRRGTHLARVGGTLVPTNASADYGGRGAVVGWRRTHDGVELAAAGEAIPIARGATARALRDRARTDAMLASGRCSACRSPTRARARCVDFDARALARCAADGCTAPRAPREQGRQDEGCRRALLACASGGSSSRRRRRCAATVGEIGRAAEETCSTVSSPIERRAATRAWVIRLSVDHSSGFTARHANIQNFKVWNRRYQGCDHLASACVPARRPHGAARRHAARGTPLRARRVRAQVRVRSRALFDRRGGATRGFGTLITQRPATSCSRSSTGWRRGSPRPLEALVALSAQLVLRYLTVHLVEKAERRARARVSPTLVSKLTELVLFVVER